MRANRGFLMLLLLALTAGRTAMAATIAVLPGSGGLQFSDYGSNFTLGWSFTLSVPLMITDLGYFYGNNGLAAGWNLG